MPTTIAQRADEIIAAATAKSHTPGESIEARRLGNDWEIGVLRANIRALCAEINDQRDTISRLRCTITELRGDLEDARDTIERLDPPMRDAEDDSAERRGAAAAFANSTGAAAALRGEV